MKKHITFIYPKMVMGGAEKVLIRMLKCIDPNKYDINIILTKSGGELESEIPEYVSVEYCTVSSPVEDLKKLKLKKLIKGIYYRLRIRIAKTYEEKSYWTSKVYILPDTVSKDCVVVYSHLNFLSICLGAASNAKKKILWVHMGFRDNLNKDLYNRMLEKYEKVFCVSNYAKTNFNELFPDHTYKSDIFYNIVDVDKITTDSLAPIRTQLKKHSIVTAGRLDLQKGQLLIPETTRKLLDNGYEVYWYLIGEGSLREEIEAKIKAHNVEKHVILLGNQSNPFPYVARCDIYAQPSSYEGYCTTTNEARVLAKPTIVFDIPSMHEQFISGINGLIIDSTVESLYQGIKYMLDHPEVCLKFTEKLKEQDYSNRDELNKLYSFLEA